MPALMKIADGICFGTGMIIASFVMGFVFHIGFCR